MRYGAIETTMGRFPWWLVMIEGIAACIVGILLLVSPVRTTILLVQVLGFYWLISGVVELVSLFVDRTQWGWKLLAGILGVLAGLVVIRNPLFSALFLPAVLVIWLGAFSVVRGIAQFFHAFSGGGFWMAIIGLMNVLFGAILLFNPLIGALALPIVLGVIAIIGGITAFIGSFRLRDLEAGVRQPPRAQSI